MSTNAAAGAVSRWQAVIDSSPVCAEHFHGIHFRNVMYAGLAQGNAVAAQVVNALPPAGS